MGNDATCVSAMTKIPHLTVEISCRSLLVIPWVTGRSGDSSGPIAPAKNDDFRLWWTAFVYSCCYSRCQLKMFTRGNRASTAAMADRSTLIRQWQMLRQLAASRRGCCVRDLATQYEASEKTIRRDLDALQLGGFDVVSTPGDRGQKLWRIAGAAEFASINFDVSEVAALYLGRRFLEPLAGTTLWDSAQSAFVKLRQQFRPEALKYLESLARTVHETTFGQSDYSQRAEVIDLLMAGIDDCRTTRLLYHPLRSETPDSYELHPLGLVWHRGSLYLVASSSERSEPRHFKVDRIRDVSVLTEPFTRPADFDLETHLQNSLGIYQSDAPLTEVRLWFSADVARYVTEHRWHHSQQIKEQPDGSLIVDLQLSDLTELKSWVLSFGSQTQILAPAELRELLRQELTELLKLYDAPSQRVPHRRK